MPVSFELSLNVLVNLLMQMPRLEHLELRDGVMRHDVTSEWKSPTVRLPNLRDGFLGERFDISATIVEHISAPLVPYLHLQRCLLPLPFKVAFRGRPLLRTHLKAAAADGRPLGALYLSYDSNYAECITMLDIRGQHTPALVTYTSRDDLFRLRVDYSGPDPDYNFFGHLSGFQN